MAFVHYPLKPRAAFSECVPEHVQAAAAPHAARPALRLRGAVLCAALCAALAGPLAMVPAQAAVLGEANVRSWLGQKLDAEIEISSLTAAEAEALLVRIPAADAFTAAGIDMTALVRSLRVTLEKRGDQTFVRLNSDQAVNEPFLMLLVELNAGGTRTVRQYALLIDPAPLDRPQSFNVEPAIAEPQSPEGKSPAESAAPPAADNAAAQSGVPAAAAATNAAPAGNSRLIATTTRRVRKGETLVAIGNEVKPEGVRLEQVLVALQRANPQAFAGNNINRMKSGSVLSVPSSDSMRDIDANAARRIVIAQSADFQRYREALAERMNIPAATAGNDAAAPTAGNRSSSGAVGVTVKEPGVRPEPQDQLKLTAPGQQSANAAANARGANDRKAVDQIAADKALADANSRIAALEKNLTQMEQMLEVRDRKLADAQNAAELAAQDTKKTVAKPVAGPSNDTPKDSSNQAPKGTSPAAVKTPAASPATARQHAWVKYLSDPVVRAMAAGAAVIALLALLGARWRARAQAGGKQDGRGKRSKVNLVGSGTVNPPVASTAGDADTTVPQAPAATPPALAAVKGEAKGSRKASAGDVDAIDEADVYIAYGRDEQAEEILRDALRYQPQRHALHVKLLEIYAARRDRKAFGELAAELCALTGSKGSAWEQAAQMGQMLDPGNPLYGSGSQQAPAANSTSRSAASPLQAVPSPGRDGGKQAASSVDDFGLKLEGLLDEQRHQGKPMPPMQAPMQPSAASGGPDFSLSGIGRGEAGSKRIEPTLSDKSDQAALSTKLDLAQACEEIGDHEGARELLAEVAAARDPELSRRAQDMLRKLA